MIGSMYPISAQIATFPDLQYMAEIAVDVVNANGGIAPAIDHADFCNTICPISDIALAPGRAGVP